jgi:hypothetical protein
LVQANKKARKIWKRLWSKERLSIQKDIPIQRYKGYEVESAQYDYNTRTGYKWKLNWCLGNYRKFKGSCHCSDCRNPRHDGRKGKSCLTLQEVKFDDYCKQVGLNGKHLV